jgi:hypothetical protein
VSAPVFTRTFALPSGPRVRLRLAQPADRERIACLLRERGVEASDLDIRRLIAYEPSTRRVACAFAPVDGRETLVGVAAIDLEPGATVDTLVIDERLTDGLGELMVGVLTERAARSRRVA